MVCAASLIACTARQHSSSFLRVSAAARRRRAEELAGDLVREEEAAAPPPSAASRRDRRGVGARRAEARAAARVEERDARLGRAARRRLADGGGGGGGIGAGLGARRLEAEALEHQLLLLLPVGLVLLPERVVELLDRQPPRLLDRVDDDPVLLAVEEVPSRPASSGWRLGGAQGGASSATSFSPDASRSSALMWFVVRKRCVATSTADFGAAPVLCSRAVCRRISSRCARRRALGVAAGADLRREGRGSSAGMNLWRKLQARRRAERAVTGRRERAARAEARGTMADLAPLLASRPTSRPPEGRLTSP